MHLFFNRYFYAAFMVFALIMFFNVNRGEAMRISTEEEIERLVPQGWPKNGLLVFPEAGRDPYLTHR